ncbi:MAG: substrate-binding periplasmic protein [Pseudomonadales bacterium]
MKVYRNVKKTGFSIVIGLLVLVALPLKAQERFVFSTMGSRVGDTVETVIKEAYQRLGIEVEVSKFPGRRSMATSNSGETDGELVRIIHIDKEFKNLIRVPVSVYTMESVAATRNIELSHWTAEHLTQYKVGRVSGVVWSEKLTKEMSTVVADDYETLLHMMMYGRMDIILGARASLVSTSNKLNLSGIKILEPPINKVSLYHYLHKKHIDLVPKITEALQQMTQEGRIKQIKEETVLAF